VVCSSSARGPLIARSEHDGGMQTFLKAVGSDTLASLLILFTATMKVTWFKGKL
jgi:hypothetical protein